MEINSSTSLSQIKEMIAPYRSEEEIEIKLNLLNWKHYKDGNEAKFSDQLKSTQQDILLFIRNLKK